MGFDLKFGDEVLANMRKMHMHHLSGLMKLIGMAVEKILSAESGEAKDETKEQPRREELTAGRQEASRLQSAHAMADLRQSVLQELLVAIKGRGEDEAKSFILERLDQCNAVLQGASSAD